MKRIYFQSFIALLLVSSIAVSCRKNQDKNDAAEIAQQSSLGQKSMNDIGVMTAEAINEKFISFDAACATLAYDTTGTTKQITITFTATGDSACLCADGKEREGKIILSTGASFTDIGSVITSTTDGYSVNGNLIEGTRVMTIKNTTENTIKSAATVTLPDSRGTFTWNGDFVRKYVSGKDTPYLLDDEYTMTGSASGVNTGEVAYTLEIIDPLMLQVGCRWIKGGIISINASTIKEEATLEYGDGDCDNKALLKYKNKEKELTI